MFPFWNDRIWLEVHGPWIADSSKASLSIFVQGYSTIRTVTDTQIWFMGHSTPRIKIILFSFLKNLNLYFLTKMLG